MSSVIRSQNAGPAKTAAARLCDLDLSGTHIFTTNLDGSDLKTNVTGCRHPRGIVVDVRAGHIIYWADRGDPPRANTANRSLMNTRSAAQETLGPRTLRRHCIGIGN
jgi:hypothetical protein